MLTTGFSTIPFFMALIYQAVRLLPSNHPYANAVNIGRFGMRHVIAEAANNLVISSKNIDQIIVFAASLMGLGLLFMQICLLGIAFIFQPALAAMPTSFSGFFLTPTDTAPQDIAYILLDLVFGVPGMFGSCVDPNVGVTCIDTDGHAVADTSGAWILAGLSWPHPIHSGLHQMLQLYSFSLLIVATMITTYFIFVILAETAQTGTAFGKRFNKVWAPVRLVVAFGLLVPVGYGLNSSQYIVLYAAKFGSGFANNGWKIFNQTLSDSYLGAVTSLISQPNIPEVGGLLQFMYVARTCAELENFKHPPPSILNGAVMPYLVKDPLTITSALPIDKDTSYDEMITFIDGSRQAIIRFGIKSDEDYRWQKGHVSPICGELVFPLADPRKPAASSTTGPPLPPNTGGSGSSTTSDPNDPEPGAVIMQKYYWYMIKNLWFDVFQGTPNFPLNTAKVYTQWKHDPNALLPPPGYKMWMQEDYTDQVRGAMLDPASEGLQDAVGDTGAIESEQDSRFRVDPVLLAKGWAAGAVWYNKIAEINGVITTAVLGIPSPSRYPKVMEYVLFKKRLQNEHVSQSERFKPVLANGENLFPQSPGDSQMAIALWEAFNYWQADGQIASYEAGVTGNAFIDAVNALFGTEGLYNMRRNPGVHPLAQIVGVGKSLVESAIRNISYAAMASVGGGLAATFIDKFFGQAANLAVGFLMTVATIALVAGFTLYYVIPFLPFIYFFFAVINWIKTIFEAMVGAPLWALAHIRIDGNGLSGDAALSGYLLIFEIFLRPILIIFGLLASISVFAAIADMLNMTWDIVTANLTGFDTQAETDSGLGASQLFLFRNSIDQFFYTVIYTIIIYLLGMSSFKLIDHIPRQILRWMGQSVKAFGESEDPAEGLVSVTTVGAQQAIEKIGGGAKGLMSRISQGF